MSLVHAIVVLAVQVLWISGPAMDNLGVQGVHVLCYVGRNVVVSCTWLLDAGQGCKIQSAVANSTLLNFGSDNGRVRSDPG